MKLKIILGTFLLIFGSCYVVFFHTDAPLKLVARTFNALGFKVEHVQGSLSSGFSIESVAFGLEGAESFKLKDVVFDFNGVLDLWLNKRLHVRNFRIGELEWHGVSFGDSEKKKNVTPKKRGTNKPTSFLKSYQIDEVQIGKVSIWFNNRAAPFVLDSFKLSGLSSSNKHNFDRFEFFSNFGSLVIETTSGRKSDGWSVNGVLRPAWLPILKHDLTFKGDMLISDGQLSLLKLSGFDQQVIAELKGNDLHVHASDLSLGYYFKTEMPITGLSGDLVLKDAKKSIELRNLEAKDFDLNIGVTKFSIKNGLFVSNYGDELGMDLESQMPSYGKVKLDIRLKSSFHQDDPIPYRFLLQSKKKLSRDQLVSLLHFGSLPEKLTSEQLADLPSLSSIYEVQDEVP